MQSSSVGHQGISSFAPFMDSPVPRGAPEKSAAAPSAAAAVFADYRSSDTQAVAAIRTTRDADPLKFKIRHAGNSLADVIKSARVRGELNKLVEVAKDMNVREIEIKAYFPGLKEGAKPRAQAVKNYLVIKGVDENVITLSPKGPGYGNKDSGLARDKAVVIEIYGSPKQNVPLHESSSPAKRSRETPARLISFI
jgi:hypothetical protein